MEKIVSLAKRRGFVFPSSEIYGGFGSCYDFGPLGVEMKNNIKKAWWDEMLKKHEDIVGLDAAILMSPKVWQASGHLTAGFADELVECKKCHHRFRLDEIQNSQCLECGGELIKSRKFNLMMKTFVGSVENEATLTYLRAETCQGIYVNFKNVLQTMRLKIPFGIAQIGKAFRNEITPKDFIYRTREFEQMELQWFCAPKTADKFFDYWKKERINWYLNLGIKKADLRVKEVPKNELPHYAKRALDIEYKFPFGWKEIEGVHNRGDWDLSNHSRNSGEDLKYEGYFPYIIETSVGVDRSLFAFLCDAYIEVSGGRTKTTKATKEVETMLKFHKSLAPIKVAVLPLVKNKPAIIKKAEEVYQILKPHFNCQYDETDSIGRRYRRQDEIGTVFCLTIDFESLEKNDLTIRNRDTMKQERVKIKNIKECLEKLL
ncbi:MAG: glycine--tRNA ligase [Candidatus Nealsonbacteria bacterium CG10_big_fil_rev_8_21_14_0_10_36_24]|uniref:Glycine--tRNA ligase n=2 Tax=Candidatus Nealsoniibacteriota TaxID=1817911 RepID=A0A2H0YR98_9BACT|nr:MAG: glycine--tRNA ligase [Candidatus Nealsonbacteria bacterium CG10_big_fil_rev_8_21_14_0_10_36_24]PIS40273.1 MAG: glycine--tRNA ligase [Candidatus Nealsonbacteria bacterium CG08_land_8_20_14_0_20_36_22]